MLCYMLLHVATCCYTLGSIFEGCLEQKRYTLEHVALSLETFVDFGWFWSIFEGCLEQKRYTLEHVALSLETSLKNGPNM